MRNLNKLWIVLISVVATSGVFIARTALAHEAYVLKPAQFLCGLHDRSVNVFNALKSPHNQVLVAVIGVGVIVAFALHILFRNTWPGQKLYSLFERAAKVGPLILRVTVGASFIVGSFTNGFLGPELPITGLPWAIAIKIVMFVAGIFITLGLFTRLSALAVALVFAVAASSYRLYLFTYFNYVGEIVVLLLFGSGYFSLDHLFFARENKWFTAWRKYETLIIRVTYAIGLIYAAVDIKFIHSILTLQVVNQYDLTRFHLLFPSDPLLVVLGGGLAEITIAVFILIGFEMRFTVLISLFYITLSLLFFREQVWPHLILYGISFYLLTMPETFTVDNWVSKKIKLMRA